MSELPAPSQGKYDVLKTASLIHDIFRWSKGDDDVDPKIAMYIGFNFGHLIDFSQAPKIKSEAIKAVANTRAKFHYKPTSLHDAKFKAWAMVPGLLDQIHQAATSGYPPMAPSGLAEKLLDADYAWTPSARAVHNAERKEKKLEPDPPLDKPYDSNMVKHGFLAEPTGQHKEYNQMFADATRQLIDECTMDNSFGRLRRDKLKVVTMAHVAFFPDDEVRLQEKYPDLFN
jgi:hypothetical protein